MFWEHYKDDICFGNLSKIEFTVDGIEGWRANGVSVFRHTKPDKQTKPRAHRFAVNPPVGFVGSCNPLRVGKWYSHLYQTKVQVKKELKTLHSRQMAMELKRICGHNYCPRKYDIGTKNSAKSTYYIREQRVDQQPQIHNFRPLSQ